MFNIRFTVLIPRTLPRAAVRKSIAAIQNRDEHLELERSAEPPTVGGNLSHFKMSMFEGSLRNDIYYAKK